MKNFRLLWSVPISPQITSEINESIKFRTVNLGLWPLFATWIESKKCTTFNDFALPKTSLRPTCTVLCFLCCCSWSSQLRPCFFTHRLFSFISRGCPAPPGLTRCDRLENAFPAVVSQKIDSEAENYFLLVGIRFSWKAIHDPAGCTPVRWAVKYASGYVLVWHTLLHTVAAAANNFWVTLLACLR